MNTIPLIFNERKVKRTVIERSEQPSGADIPVCALLINGSHQYRDTQLENLVHCSFTSVISIETVTDNYNIEHTARLFPTVTFIIVAEKVTMGELINIAMEEVRESHVLVLKDTLKIEHRVLQKRLFERIRDEGVFCAVPRLLNGTGQPIPVNYRPVIEQNRFGIVPEILESGKTAYTFDNIALYSKAKFMQLGGFDYTIASTYWQTLDLCLRAWLWGETVRVYNSFRLFYELEIPHEDSTANASYLRFFLKNIMPVLRNRTAYIPISGFFAFWRRSGYSLFKADAQFKDARRWREKNALRFKTDIRGLTALWTTDEK
jgi:hypothetical protein